MICYPQIKVFNVNIVLLNFNFIVSFQYRENYVAVFTTNDTIRMFPAYVFACYPNVIYMPCEWLNVK